MLLAVVTSFLNEELYLGSMLESLAAQGRPPDRLLLIDDGSGDGSAQIAREFAEQHPYARVLSRPPRPHARDRLADAAELASFYWGVDKLDIQWDVVAKLDADLQLTDDCFGELERHLKDDPRLGVVGPYLSVIHRGGRMLRERCPSDHVRGPTKFYRRACFEQVFPLPVSLGWDTLDEVAARIHGWRTASIALPGGDPIHLRPTGAHDGTLRKFRRDGRTAYLYGALPGWVLLGAGRRLRDRPYGVGGLSYLLGWAWAALRRLPRADPVLRAFLRTEQRQRLRAGIRRSPGR